MFYGKIQSFSILFLSLLTGFVGYSQVVDIEKYNKKTDVYTYKVDVSKTDVWKKSDRISEGIFDKMFLSTELTKSKKSYRVLSNFNISTGRVECIKPQNGEMTILFRDHSEIVLKQNSSSDCSMTLDITYSLGENLNETTANLVYLASKDITHFKVQFDESQHYFKLRRNKYKMVKQHFGMILDNMIHERYKSYKISENYYASTN